MEPWLRFTESLGSADGVDDCNGEYKQNSA